MTGKGAYAELLAQRFELACRRLKLNQRGFEMNTKAFAAPAPESGQLTLF
jgi:hypothetical protein